MRQQCPVSKVFLPVIGKARYLMFFEEAIKKKFNNVTDYWYRFEWQQRGSGHIRGFI
jgi:hypothetical protein